LVIHQEIGATDEFAARRLLHSEAKTTRASRAIPLARLINQTEGKSYDEICSFGARTERHPSLHRTFGKGAEGKRSIASDASR
jgi:hypothetical protein